MITIVYILFADVLVKLGLNASFSAYLSDILVICSVAITLYSGAEYIVKNKELINTRK